MNGHVGGDTEWHEESECPSGLRNNDDRVDNGVGDTSQNGGPVEVDGEEGGGIDEDVEESGNDQGKDVLEVVAMGTV